MLVQNISNLRKYFYFDMLIVVLLGIYSQQ